MNRIKARKFTKKVIRTVFIAAVVLYLGFLWYLNHSVERFIQTVATDLDVEYGQVWADFSGNLYINDIQYYESGEYPLLTIGGLQVNFESVGTLLTINEYAAYQRFPPYVKLNIEDIQTSNEFDLFARLGELNLPFNPAVIPPACQEILTSSPSPINFTSEALFTFNRDQRQFLFDATVDTIALADINLSGQISDIENEDLMSGFLENIAFRITNFVWLQQTLNQCRNTTGQTQVGQLADTFVNQLKQTASENHYVLSDKLVSQYRGFIDLPEKVSLAFSPALDQTWQGLQKLPIHEITQKSTITLALNQSEVDELIASVDYLGFAKEQKAQQEETAPVTTSSFLPVNYQGLRRFIGSQVILHFKNRSQVRGVIERLTPKRIYLSEYKFGGKSELPYDFSDISFIEVSGGR